MVINTEFGKRLHRLSVIMVKASDAAGIISTRNCSIIIAYRYKHINDEKHEHDGPKPSLFAVTH